MTVRVPASPSRPSRRPSPLAVLVGVALVVTAAVFVLPDLIGLDRVVPFAQLVAFRRLLLAGLIVFAVLVAVLRPFRLTAAGLALVAVVGVGMQLPRALGDDPPTPPPGSMTLRVMTVNVNDGSTDVDDVAELLEERQPDVVAMPEAGPADRKELQRGLDELGYRVRAAPDKRRDGFDTVSVAVAPQLRDADVVTGEPGDFPAIEVTGGPLGSLRVVAYTANAPVANRMDLWLEDLPVLQRWCHGDQPAIVAGDMNATLDHSLLRESMEGCRDVAEQLGEGLTGTFPVSRPRWLGVQIDHVLVTEGIIPQRVQMIDVPSSNHRAVLAEVAVPPQG